MNRFYLPLFFCFSSFVVFGQFGVVNTLTECEICSPFQTHLVDMDGDSYKDLLTFSFKNEVLINLHKNNGQGRFEALQVLKQIANPYSYSIASPIPQDLDNDGDLDLLIGLRQRDSSSLFWYQNDGNGNLSNRKLILDSIEQLTTVVNTDMNGDGFIDVLAVVEEDYKIIWFQNDGLGNFSQQPIFSEGTRVESNSFQMIDLDGDEDLDMVYRLSSIELVWQENTGNLNFAAPQSLIEVGHIANTYFVDLDGDEDLDLVQSRQELAWHMNDGQANFGEKQIIASDSLPVGSRSIIHDFDKDGDNDIINGWGSPDTLSLYINNGQGDFSIKVISPIGMSSFWTFSKADLNNDSYMDIVIGNRVSNQLVSLTNDGSANFTLDSIVVPEANTPYYAHGVDLNGDNRLDILSSSRVDDIVFWYQNEGEQIFSNQKVIIDLEEVFYTLPKDIDSDNDIDLLTVKGGKDGQIAWYENDGFGNFPSSHFITDSTAYSNYPHFTDIDNDGLEELFVVYKNQISWFKNDRSGNFTFQDTLPMIDERYLYLDRVLSGDFNNDNLSDIIIGGDYDDLYLYYNEGENKFSDPIRLPVRWIGWWRSTVITDVDEDGDEDILYAYYWEPSHVGTLAWIENQDGEFLDEQEIDAFWGEPSIYLTDVDRDADQDILLAGYAGNEEYYESGRLVWYENRGNGSYSEPKIIVDQSNNSYGVYFAQAQDFTNDGFEDILFTSSYRDQIAWMENLYARPAISGFSFYDENENGFFDEGEEIIPNVEVQLEPKAISSYTDTEGVFRFFATDGNYNLSVQHDSCLSLTTDSSKYHIDVIDNEAVERNFGFKTISTYEHLQARLFSSFTRCSTKVPFWLSITNDGCNTTDGVYALVLDSLVEFVRAEIEPSFISGDTLFWDSNDTLFPAQEDQIKLWLQIAGAEKIGDIIHLTAFSFIRDENGILTSSGSYDYTSQIRCAYDPNDKLVYPNRNNEYDQNYTLFEEPMEYTIRFQNTGNDTAFTVIIRDQLDENLDWATFKPISASHDFETFLHKDGLIEFYFKNILLPDSTTNEPLSHGFVSYQIKTTSGLDENTSIQNTADIFFDANPPIRTNTTENILVSEFPKTTSTQSWEINSSIQFYPNPTNQILYLKTKQNIDIRQLEVNFYSSIGQLVSIQSAQKELDVSVLSNGIYFVEILQNGKRVDRGKLIIQR